MIIVIFDAARDRGAYQRRCVYGLLAMIFFFFSIFSESSELMGLKFGRNAWIGPEGDTRCNRYFPLYVAG